MATPAGTPRISSFHQPILGSPNALQKNPHRARSVSASSRIRAFEVNGKCYQAVAEANGKCHHHIAEVNDEHTL